jgi:hypothetical protein
MLPRNKLAVGQTGAGKSELFATIAREFNDLAAAGAFPASDGAESHTQQMVARVIQTPFGSFRLNDGPGLMDSRGSVADEANIRKIVDHAKECGALCAMLFVFNEHTPRFDKPLQDIFKLLVDSFGADVTGIAAIVFTHAAGMRTGEEARLAAQSICRMMEQRCSFPPGSLNLPHFQVECRPETLLRLGASEAHVEARRAATRAAIEDLLRWAASTQPYSTDKAAYGEYEDARMRREAEERATAAQRLAEAEAARAQAETARADAERRRADEAVAAARRNNNDTFVSLTRGCKIGGKRLW